MNILTFIDHIIGHLAWPGAIVVVAVIFRREFIGVLNRATMLKFAGLEVSLEQQVKEVERVAKEGGITTTYAKEAFSERFQEEISANPRWAFLDAWIELERCLKTVAESRDQIYRSPSRVISELETAGEISRSEAEVLRRLNRVRNQIAHGESELAEEDASSLIGTARSMRARLMQKVQLPAKEDDPFRMDR